MILRTRILLTLAVLGLLGAGGAGVFVGIILGDRNSEPGTTTLRIVDPAFEQLIAEPAIRSAGGFTGFGGLPALNGRVLRFGTVESIELDPPSPTGTVGGTLTVTADGATATVRFIRVERLFTITPATEPLAPGDLVQLNIEGDRAVGTLRLPTDLEAGAGVVPP